MSAVEPRAAASVLVLRPAPAGPEVLLVRRSVKSGFFPLAWVFPGGRVEDGDRAAPGGPLAASAMAAARETLEEADLWLGEPAQAADARAAFAEPSQWAAFAAAQPRLPLFPWAWWITPPEESRRFDTHFFLAVVGPAAAARPDEVETTAARWMRPVDALRSGVSLAPPTWVLLDELAELLVHTPLDALGPREAPPVRPRLRTGPEGVEILLPGHPENPVSPPFPGRSTRLVADGPRWRFA